MSVVEQIQQTNNAKIMGIIAMHGDSVEQKKLLQNESSKAKIHK